VGADFFTLLGVQPALGRGFLPEEDRPGADGVVVLSDGLWRRRFGADPSVIGRDVRIDGLPHRVIGVMPWSLTYAPYDEQLWLPIAFTPAQLAEHDEHFLLVLGRLKRGVTMAEAQASLDAVGRTLAQEYPDDNRDRGLAAAPLMEELVRDYRPRLFVLFGAAAFVLLIACANIANLLLARATARARETAIRAAIGAGRGHILRQALAESVLLAVAGGFVVIGGPGHSYGALFGNAGESGNVGQRLTSLDISSRGDYWRVALQAWKEQPLTGTGAGTFQYTWLEDRPSLKGVKQVHNLYLEQGTETGVFAFLALVGFAVVLVGYVARAAWQSGPVGERRLLLAGLLSALVVYLVSSAFEWHWYLPSSTLFFFVLAAIAVKFASREDWGAKADPTGQAGR